MAAAGPVILVVEDDGSVRQALVRLLSVTGFQAVPFASAEELTQSGRLGEAGCLVLDVRLPGRSGLELQDDLASAGCTVPVVFISGNDDECIRCRALAGGAIAFLTKP